MIGGGNLEKNVMDEIKNFWEKVINDEEVNIQHRLKASELCLKLKDESACTEPVVIISGEEEIEK